jgi:glycosyltransferase involved in cell wall biosynthesis
MGSNSMNIGGAGRIGICQYDWSMYSFIKEFVIKLAETGYLVDVFQKDPAVNLEFADAEAFTRHPNIRYFNFKVSKTLAQNFVQQCKRMLGRISWNYRQNKNCFIDGYIISKSKDIVRESMYQCFIGVEKKGLIWAGYLSKICKCPLIYYSLELYCEDHPDIEDYSYLRREEKKYHRRCRATIIQDSLRAKTLLKYNEVENCSIIYFPISIRGPLVTRRSDYFYDKYRLNNAKKILLYFGLIQDERFSGDLVRMAALFKGELVLVLHGFGDQAYLTYLGSIADTERVKLSLDFVPEERIVDVIASATIGLALYQNNNSNDRLAAFSSVKVANYLQCGVPIIAFESESFRKLLNAHRCGEMINSIDEIGQKTSMILRDYDSYREQAFIAFKLYYDFDQNFKKFVKEYDKVINNECKL